MSDVMPVDVEDLDPTPKTVTVTMRGVRYRFRELTMREYEKSLKQAQVPDPSGRNVVVLDNILLLKLLVLKSIQEPMGMTVPALIALPMTVGRKINDIVNELCYGDEVSEEEQAEQAEAAAAAATEDDGDPEVVIPVEEPDEDGPPLTS